MPWLRERLLWLRPRHLVVATAVFCALIAISSVLGTPVVRDEHLYASAACLQPDLALYDDFVYTHPPVSAWWYGAVVKLWPGHQVLLPMRLAQLGVVLTLGWVLYGVFRRLGGSPLVAAALITLLAHLDVFRDSMGFARSHELALLLAMAPWLLLPVYPGDEQQRWRLLAAGALAGLAVATRLTHAPLALLAVVWPALAPTTTSGGRREVVWTMLGAAVSLGWIALILGGTNWEALRFGLWDYHLLNARFHELAGMGHGRDGEGAWSVLLRFLRRTDLLTWLLVVLTAWGATVGWGRSWSVTRWWLAVGVMVCGLVMTVIPSPHQPSYDQALLLGGALLVAATSARLRGRPRQVVVAVLGVGVLVCLVHHAVDSSQRFVRATQPSRWPPVMIHEAGQRLDDMLSQSRGQGPVVTTHPLYALESGRPVVPALSSGEFVWRLSDSLDPAVEQRLRLVTADSIEERIAAWVPACLVVEAAAPWDQPMLDLGRQLGWELRPLVGGVVVWVRPSGYSCLDMK